VLATSLLATDSNLDRRFRGSGSFDHPDWHPPTGPSAAFGQDGGTGRGSPTLRLRKRHYVLSRDALYRMSAPGWLATSLEAGPAILSDRNISALAADKKWRIWIGYFDRGLDLLEADAARNACGERSRFCINRIMPTAGLETVEVPRQTACPIRFECPPAAVLTRPTGSSQTTSPTSLLPRWFSGRHSGGFDLPGRAGPHSMYAFMGW